MSRRKRRTSSNNQVKEIYVPVYKKSDYEKDEQAFTDFEKKGKPMSWSSFQRLMVNDICTNTKIIETGWIGNIRLDDAKHILKNPKMEWRRLLAMSEELMFVSPHYARLNNFFANMAVFNWGLDLYDVKNNVNINTLRKSFSVLSAKLETMNLKDEFGRIMTVLPYMDLYCGLVMESQEDFFFQQISYKICKLYQIQDGLYNFAMDLSRIDPKKLTAYPDYVQQAWLDFHDGKIPNWYIPPADKQICIKMNRQWSTPYPLLIGMIKDILDLDVYKQLKLQSARTDNYKAIMVKVPIDETTVDKPLITPEFLSIFAEINRESMNDDIGLIHTLGSDGEAISFKDSTNTKNNVSDAIDELYNSSGISKELFNGSSSATAVTFSIENDSAYIYKLYRQFERWMNRFIKLRRFNKSAFKYKFYILDSTIFNRDKVSSTFKDACAFGATVVDKWMASLGMTPSVILGSYVTNNQIYDFSNNFKPLQTSYTSTGDDKGGRPTNAETGEILSDSGEKTLDSDGNNDR